jgi:uncharacterized protein with HEPN domain
MITKSEFHTHLIRLSDLIREVLQETDKISETEFLKEEDLKERVFFQLQEIGQAAEEISQFYEGKEKRDVPIPELTSLKTARYNTFTEVNENAVFGIIRNDLPIIFEEVQEKLNEVREEPKVHE